MLTATAPKSASRCTGHKAVVVSYEYATYCRYAGAGAGAAQLEGQTNGAATLESRGKWNGQGISITVLLESGKVVQHYLRTQKKLLPYFDYT